MLIFGWENGCKTIHRTRKIDSYWKMCGMYRNHGYTVLYNIFKTFGKYWNWFLILIYYLVWGDCPVRMEWQNWCQNVKYLLLIWRKDVSAVHISYFSTTVTSCQKLQSLIPMLPLCCHSFIIRKFFAISCLRPHNHLQL